MLNFFYGQNPPTAEDLKEQVLNWAIGHQDDCGAAETTMALISAYVEAYRFEQADEESPVELKLLTGREAEQLSAKAYAKCYGIDIQELWDGNSGWSFPESFVYEPETARLPSEIVIIVTQAGAQRDRAQAKAFRAAYEARQGVSS